MQRARPPGFGWRHAADGHEQPVAPFLQDEQNLQVTYVINAISPALVTLRGLSVLLNLLLMRVIGGKPIGMRVMSLLDVLVKRRAPILNRRFAIYNKL